MWVKYIFRKWEEDLRREIRRELEFGAELDESGMVELENLCYES